MIGKISIHIALLAGAVMVLNATSANAGACGHFTNNANQCHNACHPFCNALNKNDPDGYRRCLRIYCSKFYKRNVPLGSGSYTATPKPGQGR